MRFVFPHAPMRPVTINNGMRMRAWYDIFQFGGGPEDEAGIRASQKIVEALIGAEKGKKIVLAGFSQGGAIVLQAALRHAKALAGVLALSTSSAAGRESASGGPRARTAQSRSSWRTANTTRSSCPHRAEASRDALQRLGYAVEWHSYPMPHSVCAPEIADISQAS